KEQKNRAAIGSPVCFRPNIEKTEVQKRSVQLSLVPAGRHCAIFCPYGYGKRIWKGQNEKIP
ncbi:hypothetical protein R1T16_18000, partial [Flavobacterium sp. DG1-102-2]|uniref:hypothetical protein n=1 Tax=Flavobacterium sp. DG1-102-2 TaxID=3081663 RepID=UPI0029497682